MRQRPEPSRLRPGIAPWVSGRERESRARAVPGTPAQKPGRAQRPNRARPGAAVAHAHAHARERRLPRSRGRAQVGRRREPRSRELQAGRVPED
ncbi:hypothetical protein NN561_012605 [Cricetulus griseus]